MEMMTTITSQFQVHIPVAIRKAAGLKKHGRAVISVEGKNIIIKQATPNFLSLGGKFKVKNPIPAEKIRDYIDYSDL
jgi:bifunctional DNA-binding transcriptional regulator/antitoxin component of YhaV-PrlF toxin-antitoxin module